MKKKLFVFGGFYDTGVSYKYYNDVWMFSLETYQWQQIKPTGSIVPAPRSAGCMVPTPDGKIVIFGGYSKTSVKKEIDRGVTHTDMFALVPESEYISVIGFWHKGQFTLLTQFPCILTHFLHQFSTEFHRGRCIRFKMEMGQREGRWFPANTPKWC